MSPPPSRHWKLQVSQEGDINIVSMDLRDTDRSDRTTGLQMQTSQAESLNLMELNVFMFPDPLETFMFFSKWICFCSVCAARTDSYCMCTTCLF